MANDDKPPTAFHNVVALPPGYWAWPLARAALEPLGRVVAVGLRSGRWVPLTFATRGGKNAALVAVEELSDAQDFEVRYRP